MIFPIIFFLTSTFFGYQLIKLFTNTFKQEEMMISGLLFGSSINIIFNYFLANLFGFSPQMIVISQSLLLILSIVLFMYTKEKLTASDFRLRLSLILITIISLFIFIPLFVPHMLYVKSGDYYTGGFTYGDLAFHTTLINSFVYGNNFPPQNPVYSGTKLAYPPAIDFLSAMFVLTGSSIQQALYLPGIIYAVTIALVAFLFAYKITKKILASFLTPALLIFNGGIGFIYFILDMQNEGKDILTALSTMTKEYAHLMDYNIRFSNIVADYFLPQRAFLLGFSVGIVILIFIFDYLKNKKNGNLIIAGILTGLLPIIHPHSLIAIFIILSIVILLNLKWILINFVKYFILPFSAFALLPMLQILNTDNAGLKFLRVQLFWMANQDNPIWFYFKNLGIIFPLILIVLFFVPKNLIKTYIPFAFIFVITNIIIFQPHDYDNMKIMLYWFLATVILISYFLAILWQKRSIMSRTLFCILVFFSLITGMLSVYRESYSRFQMYDGRGIYVAEKIREITSPADIILTSDQHNHPISTFSGRKIVMGYRGWLWTWGYDYREREKDVMDIYQGSASAKELIKKYGISLIVIGPTEKSQFLANESYFDQNFRLLLRTNDYKVYNAKSIR